MVTSSGYLAVRPSGRNNTPTQGLHRPFAGSRRVVRIPARVVIRPAVASDRDVWRYVRRYDPASRRIGMFGGTCGDTTQLRAGSGRLAARAEIRPAVAPDRDVYQHVQRYDPLSRRIGTFGGTCGDTTRCRAGSGRLAARAVIGLALSARSSQGRWTAYPRRRTAQVKVWTPPPGVTCSSRSECSRRKSGANALARASAS